jgi:hypothetical protein
MANGKQQQHFLIEHHLSPAKSEPLQNVCG